MFSNNHARSKGCVPIGGDTFVLLCQISVYLVRLCVCVCVYLCVVFVCNVSVMCLYNYVSVVSICGLRVCVMCLHVVCKSVV